MSDYVRVVVFFFLPMRSHPAFPICSVCSGCYVQNPSQGGLRQANGPLVFVTNVVPFLFCCPFSPCFVEFKVAIWERVSFEESLFGSYQAELMIFAYNCVLSMISFALVLPCVSAVSSTKPLYFFWKLLLLWLYPQIMELTHRRKNSLSIPLENFLSSSAHPQANSAII